MYLQKFAKHAFDTMKQWKEDVFKTTNHCLQTFVISSITKYSSRRLQAPTRNGDIQCLHHSPKFASSQKLKMQKMMEPAMQARFAARLIAIAYSPHDEGGLRRALVAYGLAVS